MDEEERRRTEEKRAAKRARQESESREGGEVGSSSSAVPEESSKREGAEGEEDEERRRRKAEKKAAKKLLKSSKGESEGNTAAVEEVEEVAEPVVPAASGGKRPRSSSSEVEKSAGVSSSSSSSTTFRSSASSSASAASSPAVSSAIPGWPSYVESPAVASQKPSAIAEWRSSKGVAVSDDFDAKATWRPILSFADAATNFPEPALRCTSSFSNPSAIQSQSWPIQLSGRDMVGIAQTGSGKTLAFMLPAISHILAVRKAAGGGGKGHGKSSSSSNSSSASSHYPKCAPILLVVAPTRELAMQTAEVATKAGQPAGLESVCVYGGVPKEVQRRELSAGGGAPIVIATPGRLLDLLEEGALTLERVTYLVLDEADRMLDLGFEKDIRSIISKTASHDKGRQTLMFSATWPPTIQAIASEFLSSPVRVTIGSAELAASHSVTQLVDVVENPSDRDRLILGLLTKYHSTRTNRVIIFVLYKKEADRVERFLSSKGWSCCSIHGDMSQEARTRSFNTFRDGKVPLLVATDVAARGLDIPNVEYVINYSFPLTIEDYVHRIGRTGRAGKTGISHTFFTPLDKPRAGELVNVLREAGATVPEALLKFGTHIKKKEHSLYGAHFKADAGGGGGAAAAPTRMTFD